MKAKTTNLSLVKRLTAPTPSFFRTIRKIGLILGAVGGTLLTAPVSLPAAITAIAGYLATAGLVATAVASAAVEQEQQEDLEKE